MNLRRRIKAMQTYLLQRQEILHFSGVCDPRSRQGRRWELPPLLAGALVSLVLLSRSLREAERMSEDLASSRLLRRLGIRRRIPDSTLGDLLACLPPIELLKQLYRQVHAEHRRKALKPERLPVGVVAIDGKAQALFDEPANAFTCQRQGGEHGPARYLHRVLNATLISSRATVCIQQLPIAACSNEMGSFRSFFEQLLAAYGKSDLFEVVTSDAGVISRESAGWLDAQGIGYVVAIKDNNPGLELQARGLLQDLAEHEPPVASDEGFEPDGSRGWVKRQLWTSTELAGWMDWPHLRQVWLVRVWRKRSKEGSIEHLEDRLYATNLPTRHRIRKKHILALIRGHWRIENDLHGTLDVQLREDDNGWVRRGYGLMNTGLLRVMAYNLLAIARSVHLRAKRPVAWRQLRDWLRDAFLWPPLTHAAIIDDFAPG